MRSACAGTILAGELALAHGLAINMSGGYHHAKPEAGEGFCVYNDIGLLVDRLRSTGRIAEHARIVYIDLDVHQGNGVCHCFLEDRRVAIFDMYNRSIYPAYDRAALARIDHAVPLDPGCGTQRYLELLRSHLAEFLDGVAAAGEMALVIYIAGTDVLAGDPLGGLDVSRQGIIERDALVVAQARSRNLPCVVLPGGGYTHESHKVIADSVIRLVGGSLSA
jgi:histone deacetylase 11